MCMRLSQPMRTTTREPTRREIPVKGDAERSSSTYSFRWPHIQHGYIHPVRSFRLMPRLLRQDRLLDRRTCGRPCPFRLTTSLRKSTWWWYVVNKELALAWWVALFHAPVGCLQLCGSWGRIKTPISASTCASKQAQTSLFACLLWATTTRFWRLERNRPRSPTFPAACLPSLSKSRLSSWSAFTWFQYASNVLSCLLPFFQKIKPESPKNPKILFPPKAKSV